jgi:hypothetical protein
MKQHKAIFQQNGWRDFQKKRIVKTNSNEKINPEYDKVSFDWIQ